MVKISDTQSTVGTLLIYERLIKKHLRFALKILQKVPGTQASINYEGICPRKMCEGGGRGAAPYNNFITSDSPANFMEGTWSPCQQNVFTHELIYSGQRPFMC